MDFDSLYRLAPDETRGVIVPELPTESLDLEDQTRLTLGEIPPPETPLRFRHLSGSRRVDVIGASTVVVTLISGRVRAALEAGGFSGWSAVPAAIAMQDGEVEDGYSVLVVTGRAGKLQPKRSKRVLVPAYPGGPDAVARRGMYFKERSWDGSDVFAPEGTTLVFLTQPVRDAIAALNPTNALLERLTEIDQL